jgi:hypothetical protein
MGGSERTGQFRGNVTEALTQTCENERSFTYEILLPCGGVIAGTIDRGVNSAYSALQLVERIEPSALEIKLTKIKTQNDRLRIV